MVTKPGEVVAARGSGMRVPPLEVAHWDLGEEQQGTSPAVGEAGVALPPPHHRHHGSRDPRWEDAPLVALVALVVLVVLQLSWATGRQEREDVKAG